MVRGTYSKGHARPGASWWKGWQGQKRRRGTGRGAGGEGEGPLALSALQLGSVSLMGFCPDARGGTGWKDANTPSLDAMWYK